MTDEGMIIVVEGMDGCGKTTQTRELKKFLDSKGIKSIWTCEPYTKWAAVALGHTQDPLAQLFIFAADRREHVKQMQQWLKEGYWVICDRYFFSSYAYQQFAGEVDPYTVAECIKESIRLTEDKLLLPDLTLWLDLDIDPAIARIEQRDKELVTDAERDRLKSVRLGYKACWQMQGVGNISLSAYKKQLIRIDCNDRTEDDIQNEIRAIVDQKLLGVKEFSSVDIV